MVDFLSLDPIATGENTPSNVLAIVDIADTTQGPSGSTVGILMSQLFRMETTAVTASAPIIDARQTWNNAAVTFTGINVNITSTASATASRLQAWQVAGTDKVVILKSGDMTIHSITVGLGADAVATNTALGTSALTGTLTTLAGNVAVGYEAIKIATSGTGSTAVGYRALVALTGAQGNTAIGYEALKTVISSGNNTAVGYQTLTLTTGASNTAIGYLAGGTLSTGATNTALGSRALGNNATGSGCVAIGFFAGRYETASDAFYVDNQDRTNTAGDKAKALCYGVFAAAAANQTIRFNVGRFQISNIPTSSAGLSSGDVWSNAGVLTIV